MTKLSIALIGAGVIGRTHVNRIGLSNNLQLVGITDPTDAGRRFAESVHTPWFADHHAMLDALKPQGVIVATPNQSHVSCALDCLNRGIATLVEKPVANEVGQALHLAAASEQLQVPVLVGHHRRHNPINRRARDWVRSGKLGRIVNVSAMACMYKPDSYYEAAWRREPGGGPILINLIHDIDMLRFIVGDIVEVQAFASNQVRGFDMEDSAAATLKFANGALGTLVVSDTAAGPFCWDFCAGEQDQYPRQEVQSHVIMGTHGSLSLPGLQYFHYQGERHWHREMTLEKTFVHHEDPYSAQLQHFRAVILGEAEPVCSARDGAGTLAATLAIRDAAKTGQTQVLRV